MDEKSDKSENEKTKWYNTAILVLMGLLYIEWHFAFIVAVFIEGFEWIYLFVILTLVIIDFWLAWALLRKSPKTEPIPITETEPKATPFGKKKLIFFHFLCTLGIVVWCGYGFVMYSDIKDSNVLFQILTGLMWLQILFFPICFILSNQNEFSSSPNHSASEEWSHFSLLSLMLFVTVVGLFFGVARLLPQNYFLENRYLSLYVFLLGSVIWILYSIWVKPSFFALACYLSCTVTVSAFPFVIKILFDDVEADVDADAEPFASLFRLMALTLYWNLSIIFLILLAATISIVNCKKATGSVFPFVGKKPEE